MNLQEIERALQFGSRAELRWLFHQVPRQQIREWVDLFGRERLPHPHPVRAASQTAVRPAKASTRDGRRDGCQGRKNDPFIFLP
jgi:hypothetical protein